MRSLLMGLSFFIITGCGDSDSVATTASTGAAGAAGTGAGGAGGGGAGAGGGQGGTAGQPTGGMGGEGGSFEGVDPIRGTSEPALVQGGFQFIEGPVWVASESRLLFSDIPASIIYELTLPNTVEVFRDGSGNANGLGLDADGLLIACEHSTRRVTRTLTNGSVVPIATEWQSDPLNSPNDNITRSDGTVYFTDPRYGLGGQPSALGFQGVYRVDPGGVLHLEEDDMTAPNGIALSPDETVLYVADSEDGFVRRYDVASDGSLSAPQLFTSAVSSPDGMAVDDAGNLYIAGGAGVVVLRSDGTPWGTIAVDEQPANCTFGGPDRRTLFITARTGLYRVDLNVPGKP